MRDIYLDPMAVSGLHTPYRLSHRMPAILNMLVAASQNAIDHSEAGRAYWQKKQPMLLAQKITCSIFTFMHCIVKSPFLLN
jgi:hypothetical protein